MDNLEQYRADVEAAQKEAREAKAWLQFLLQHPEVSNVESNRLLASEYHGGTEVTLESLLDSYNSPGFRAMLAYIDPAKQRAEALAAIQAITAVGESPLTKWTPTETLVKRANELEERRELSKKSPAELRAIIQQGTPAIEPDDLPPHMDRAFLLSLNKAGEFRRVCERYGVVAVTRALNTRR